MDPRQRRAMYAKQQRVRRVAGPQQDINAWNDERKAVVKKWLVGAGIGATLGAGAGALALRHGIGAVPGALFGGSIGGAIAGGRAESTTEHQVKKVRAERAIMRHLKRHKHDLITIRNGEIKIRKNALLRQRVKRIDMGERSKYTGRL